MHKLTPVLMAAALGAAMILGGGAPYEMAQKHLEIQQTTANETLKAAAVTEMMDAARAEAPLPPGMALVMPSSSGDRVVIARRVRA